MALTQEAKDRWVIFFGVSVWNSFVFWALFIVVYLVGVIVSLDWRWITDWATVYLGWGLFYILGWAKFWEDSRND